MKHFSPLIKNKRTLAYISLIFSMMLWSSNVLLTRANVGQIPPVGLAFFRWSIAAFILASFNYSAVFAHRHILIKEYKKVVVLALLGVTFYSSTIYTALQSTTAINANTIGSSGPLLTTLLVWFLLKEKTSALQIISIMLACVGVGIVITRGSFETLLSISFNDGDLLVITAVLIWSIYSILIQKWQLNLPPFVLLTLQACVGICGLFVLYCIESLNNGVYWPNYSHWPTIIYLAIFPSIISFSLWLSAVKELGSALTSLFGYMQIVFTTTFACLFLNESLHTYQVIGALFILVGLYLYTRNKIALPVQEAT